MNTLLPVILSTGFAVAFLHAAIPTHWLPFVLIARAQRWNRPKTLAITALAGGGHVLATTALGVLLVWFGIKLDERAGAAFPWLAGSVLILIGLVYLALQARGGGHGHTHLFGQRHDELFYEAHTHDHGEESSHDAGGHDRDRGHDRPHDQGHVHHHDDDHGHRHPHDDPHKAKTVPASDWAAIGGLFALLTFSPCEGFLPVYVSGIQYGWLGFALLSAVLAGATLAGMLFFTWLTLAGFERLNLRAIDKYETGILGGVLCFLGMLIILLEH